MNAKGFAYLIMKEDDNFPFLEKDIPVEDVEGENKIPQQTAFQTIYISAGKKDC